MKMFKRILFMVLIAIGVFGMVMELIPTNKCYSEEYSLYATLKDATNVDELRQTLQGKKLEYTLKDNVLKLTKYKNISFDVFDDKTCLIASNTVMNNFARLDDDTIADKIITGKLNEDKVKETIELIDEGDTYLKENGEYYIKNRFNIIPFSIYFGFFFVFTVALFLEYDPKELRKQRAKKQRTNQV